MIIIVDMAALTVSFAEFEDPARAYGGVGGAEVFGHARGRRQRIATGIGTITLQRVFIELSRDGGFAAGVVVP